MREIFRAELIYESTYPANGFACSLAALGGDPKSGPPGPMAAQIINGDLASSIDHGYIFKITNCTKLTIHGTDMITGYNVTAVPQTPGKTGHRGFCDNQFGELKADPDGGTNCTVSLEE
jgi:type IV pilus assembly protein PilA